MLNFLRYSQLLALAVLVAVVAALSMLYRGLVFDAMVESESHASVALTKTFANAVWPAHAEFVKRASSLDRATLAERPELAALDHQLRRLADGLPIVKVKIYDLNGLTVFSTDARQIGEDKAPNPGFQRARDGYPASNLTYRERFDSWEGELAERHILATYVPVHVYEAAPVEAVLEVYSDVTELVARMERSQWTILAAVLGGMAAVYLAMQLMLARYHRLLREKERERAAQEERIRHQAYHDSLTGLPNRASFGEHLDEAMRRAKRAGWPLALLFLPL
jgi:predicted signal transduction protein with EAL and GGDEF domain